MEKIEYDIIYYSDSWHAGTRLECDDALKKGFKAMKEIYQRNTEWRKFEIIKAASGNEVNMHPSKCEFRVRRWYEEPETPQSVTAEIKGMLNDLLVQDRSMRYEMKQL